MGHCDLTRGTMNCGSDCGASKIQDIEYDTHYTLDQCVIKKEAKVNRTTSNSNRKMCEKTEQ
jgi:hypothetical protein